MLARKKGPDPAFVGKVGMGWSMKASVALRRWLKAIKADQPSVVVPGRPPKAVWVQPRIKAHVEYRDITTAGLLRHAVWKGGK